ncbi:aminoacyl-tRNA hydrolase [Carnobacteriaceae bacterium zg-C25]|nr:aminoacyl-tRNA hydrolase [Carnobacteriaceae bacterium zg-C25]
MVKMIVGLGNPGEKYHETKHNIGFMVLDEWAKREGVTFNHSKHKGLFAELFINGEKVLLVKPQTYMNLSGECVKPLMDYFKIDKDDMVVIYDDMDLPIGKIRLRQKGSAGGHNGIKSLIQHLGTQEFNRVRMGIGRPLEFETVIQHVLSKFLGIYKNDVDVSIDKTIDAMSYFAKTKQDNAFLNTMNHFN